MTVAAPLIDIVIFMLATGQGMLLSEAQLVSFGVAYLVNYFLTARPAAVAAGRGGDLRLHVHLLIVSLVVLFLRGGLLGLLVNVWHWPTQVAIVFAALQRYLVQGLTLGSVK